MFWFEQQQNDKTTISPLAMSTLAPLEEGQLKCIGVYQHAINLINPSGALLTLHRFNKGLTPAGLLLKPQHFDHIAYLQRIGLPIHCTNNTLYCHGVTLTIKQVRQINLTIPKAYPLIPSQLYTLLPNIAADKVTGLHGKLATLNITSNNLLLTKYYDFLSDLVEQYPLNYSILLGEGPGLTPSSDDILIGLLAYAYLQPILQSHIKESLFALTQLNNLTPFTTLISSHFITHASQGFFSTPILHILNTLNKPDKLKINIKRLLNYGYTSGADILVGLMLAELFFTRL